MISLCGYSILFLQARNWLVNTKYKKISIKTVPENERRFQTFA